MATKKTSPPTNPQPQEPSLKLGDMVSIRRSNYKRAKIVELRGPLGPGGAYVYRVIVRGKPRPVYIEVLEEQLKLIPAEKT